MNKTRRRYQKARRKAEKREASELASRENERRRRAERPPSAPLCEIGLCAHRAQYINGGKMLCRYHAER